VQINWDWRLEKFLGYGRETGGLVEDVFDAEQETQPVEHPVAEERKETASFRSAAMFAGVGETVSDRDQAGSGA
jgi:hypothetical protein